MAAILRIAVLSWQGTVNQSGSIVLKLAVMSCHAFTTERRAVWSCICADSTASAQSSSAFACHKSKCRFVAGGHGGQRLIEGGYQSGT